MTLKIYTDDDIELINLIRKGYSNNGMCYELDWGLTTLKSRLATLYALAGVKGKAELKLKFRGVDLARL